MSIDPFLAETVLFSFNFAPRGWAQCNGQLLPINQNQALFSLLGTTYGGDGRTTFALPDLRGRAIVGNGQGPGLSSYALGQRGGSESVTLAETQLPAHAHVISGTMSAVANCASGGGNQQAPAGGLPAADAAAAVMMYSNAAPDASMSPGALAVAGGVTAVTGNSQPHENRQPYLAMTFCIALQGVYPSTE